MDIKPIKSENDYRYALSRMEVIFDSAVGTNESDEADILALMIDDYEQKYYSIEAPDPIEAIKIRMEEMGLKQKDLVKVIGGKSRVSEILHKKRKLTLEMIRNLIIRLDLSAETLLKDYPLSE
ncbi:MAG: transcriptional regulator [Bacteroidales bacterium]|nr:transcriptional regulator [Bacteroidales bacterium]